MATNYTNKSGLLDRTFLDDSYPVAKAVFGFGLWVNSCVTTVFCISALYAFATDNTANIAVYLVGIAISLILTVAQAYTVNKAKLAYTIFVLPDAFMTAVAWDNWFIGDLMDKLLHTPWQATLASMALGFVIGLVSARYPEQLVFGSDNQH